ncbi:MAG TPA: TldD/PmbA family protein, partial [bacterium]|nr:TldD/PmbA family protein [bacterium]
KLQKDNPHFPGFAGPQEYHRIPTFDPPTAEYTPVQRATDVKSIIDIGDSHGLTLAGAYFTSAEEFLVANSNGLRAYQPNTSAAISVVAMADDFSGYAQGISRRVTELNLAGIGTRACEKARMGRNPIDLEVGKYDVILEPSAICELIEWTGYVGLGSKALEEETSFLHGRLGEKVAGDNITLYDNAFEGGFTWAFDQEGIPKQEVFFIKDGIAQGIVYDRISGHKHGHDSTGHMAGQQSTGDGSAPMHIHLKAGTDKYQELLDRVERGILITRTHYVNGLLDPRKLMMTGLTRDGAFLIENGKVTKGLRNMRFTQSILESLSKVEGITAEREACPAWWGAAGTYLMPTVLIRDFEFTGKTDH